MSDAAARRQRREWAEREELMVRLRRLDRGPDGPLAARSPRAVVADRPARARQAPGPRRRGRPRLRASGRRRPASPATWGRDANRAGAPTAEGRPRLALRPSSARLRLMSISEKPAQADTSAPARALRPTPTWPAALHALRRELRRLVLRQGLRVARPGRLVAHRARRRAPGGARAPSADRRARPRRGRAPGPSSGGRRRAADLPGPRRAPSSRSVDRAEGTGATRAGRVSRSRGPRAPGAGRPRRSGRAERARARGP